MDNGSGPGLHRAHGVRPRARRSGSFGNASRHRSPPEIYGFAERHPIVGTVLTIGVLVVTGVASGELVGVVVAAAVRLALGTVNL